MRGRRMRPATAASDFQRRAAPSGSTRSCQGPRALRVVVFASRRPGKALLGALIFAFFDALQLRLQQGGAALPGMPELPYQVYLMLPYILSILALVFMARRAAYPQALMKPYRKGER